MHFQLRLDGAHAGLDDGVEAVAGGGVHGLLGCCCGLFCGRGHGGHTIVAVVGLLWGAVLQAPIGIGGGEQGGRRSH